MLAACVVTGLVETVAKVLGQDYPAIQIVWARNVFTLPVVLFLSRNYLPQLVRSGSTVLQIVRGAAPLVAGTTIIVSYGHMPLASAMAVMFSSQFLVTLIAAVVLGERIGLARWLSVAVGFTGVLVILRPSPAMEWMTLLPLVTALMFAIYQIMTRTLSHTASPLSMLFYLLLVGTVGSTAMLPFVWRTPDAEGWVLLVFEGLIYGLGHYLIIKAFSKAEASVLSPFLYFQLVTATVFGVFTFGEVPSPGAFAGMALIVGSGLFVWFRERRANRLPAPGARPCA